VLSHISDAEEDDLVERFGDDYLEYRKNVSKLLPHL